MRILFLLLLIPVVACSQQPVSNTDKPIAIISVNVIPMDKEVVLRDQVVVVQNGRVTAMGDSRRVKVPANAVRIDGKGKYLLPGLAEMHAHVPPIDDMQPMKTTSMLFALHGITTIRGMLGHPLHLELRKQLNNGTLLGPRFYTSGPSFNGNSVTSTERAEQMVREQKQAGFDFLKLHPGLVPETFDAMARTAKEVGIAFAGHVSFKVGVWRAIEAGYSTIDHLDGFVEALVPGIEDIPENQVGLFGMMVGDRADTSSVEKLMKALKEKNIWVVPTQALAERWMSPRFTAEQLAAAPEMKYMSAQQVANWSQSKSSMRNHPAFDAEAVNRFINLRRKLILACEQHGVGLLLGSDAPQVFNVPGVSTHQELEYMVLAGLTPYQALRSGTANVGRFYGKADEMGIIKEGAQSDLLLLGANPLEDITNTAKIEGIMLGKNWLNKDYIEAELKKLEKQ